VESGGPVYLRNIDVYPFLEQGAHHFLFSLQNGIRDFTAGGMQRRSRHCRSDQTETQK
jgi:hypothetical protein